MNEPKRSQTATFDKERDLNLDSKWGFYRKAIWAVDWDDRAARQAIQKIAQNLQPGKVIALTREEFRALKDRVILLIPSPTEETDNSGQLDLPF